MFFRVYLFTLFVHHNFTRIFFIIIIIIIIIGFSLVLTPFRNPMMVKRGIEVQAATATASLMVLATWPRRGFP